MALFVLIPLLPLLASIILLLGGTRWGESSHRIGIPAIGLSFVLSVAAFIEVLRNGPFTLSLYRFFQSGSLTIDLTLFVDQLTVLILLLVMSGNLLMLLISWEVMGVCSYLLISHAAQRPSACRAATKAFLVNAIADVGFSFGIILAFYTFGTLDIQTILAQAEGMQDYSINILGWMGLDLYIYPVTVIPFLLRGVNLLGIDSVMQPFENRQKAWARVAKDLPLDKLEGMIVPAVLSDLPRLGKEILKGQVKGRVVVDVNA